MTNWNNPTNSSSYSSVLTDLNAKLSVLAKQDYGSDTNLSSGFLRFNQTTKAREKYDGASWAVCPGNEHALQAVITTTGTQPTYVATPTIAWVGYVAGDVLVINPHATNSGAATVNVSSQGAKSIKWKNRALAGGELAAGVKAVLYYDGTDFILLNHGGGWVTWTTTLTGGGTIVVTAGTQTTMVYRADGDTIEIEAFMTSISSSGGTGSSLLFTAPVTGITGSPSMTGYVKDSTFFGAIVIKSTSSLLAVSKSDFSNYTTGAWSGREYLISGRYRIT